MEKLLYLDVNFAYNSCKPLIMMQLLLKTCNWYIYLDKWSHESHHQTCPKKKKKKKFHKQQNCLICFLFHIWLLVLEQGKHICNSNCSSIRSTSKSLPLHNQDIAYSNSLETKQKKGKLLYKPVVLQIDVTLPLKQFQLNNELY